MPNPETVLMWTSFAYKASVMERRCRVASTIHVRAVTPVPLRVTDPGDAPVALRLAIVPNVHIGRTALPPPIGDPIEMRFDGERLLRPMLDPEGRHVSLDGLSELMGPDHRAQKEPEWPDNPLLDYEAQHGGKLVAKGVFTLSNREGSDHRVRTWGSDDMDERQAALHARAKALTVIDGMVWRECPEPTWEVYLPFAKPLTLRLEEPEANLETVYFRIDRLEDALRLAEHQEWKGVPGGTVEVLVPDAIRRDSLQLNAPSLFDKVTEHLCESLASIRGGGAARAWADMRDAEESWRAGDVDAVHRAYAAMRRMAEADWTRSPTSMAARYDLHPNPDRVMPFLWTYETLERDRCLDDETIARLAV